MTIPDEALEYGAKILIEDGQFGVPWEDASADDRADTMELARTILEAAAPYIQAEALEEAANEIARLEAIGSTPYADCTPDEREDYSVYVHDSQAHWLRARAAEMRQG